jgi:hypothetical protein
LRISSGTVVSLLTSRTVCCIRNADGAARSIRAIASVDRARSAVRYMLLLGHVVSI